jgi:hypothetical protein
MTPNPQDGRGGSLVYIETIRDVSLENNKDPVIEERNTVVHEVGHAFHLGTEPVTMFELNGGPITYREVYLRQIRVVDKPDSR